MQIQPLGNSSAYPLLPSLACRAKTYSGFHFLAAMEGRKGEQ